VHVRGVSTTAVQVQTPEDSVQAADTPDAAEARATESDNQNLMSSGQGKRVTARSRSIVGSFLILANVKA